MMKKFKILLMMAFFALALSGRSYAQEDVDINEAIRLYNDAVTALNDKNFTTALDNAQKALKIATASEAEEAVATKQNIENLIPKIYYGEGRQLATDKKYDEALVVLQKAVDAATKYNDTEVKDAAEGLIPQLLLVNANTLLSSQKFAEAVAAYEKVIAVIPDEANAYLGLGQAQIRLNSEDAAVATLEKASQLGAKDASKLLTNIFLKKAVAGQASKKWNDVYTNAEKALSYDEDNVNGNKLLGAAAIQLKKWDTAITVYEKLLPTEKNPDNTIYSLAMAYDAKGNKAKACENFKKLVTSSNAQIKAYAEAKVKELCN